MSVSPHQNSKDVHPYCKSESIFSVYLRQNFPMSVSPHQNSPDIEEVPSSYSGANIIRLLKDGKIARVVRCIKGGANVNVHDDEGNSFLRIAFKFVHRDLLESTMKAGVKIEEKDYDILPHIVGVLRKEEWLLYFLKQNAKFVKADDSNFLFYRAIESGFQESTLEAMIDAGCLADRISTGLLVKAIESGLSANMIDLMIEKGGAYNLEQWERKNGYKSPLIEAISKGRFDLVQLLVKKGSDINAEDGLGNTPLEEAARTKNIDILNYLFAFKNLDKSNADDVVGVALDVAKSSSNEYFSYAIKNISEEVDDITMFILTVGFIVGVPVGAILMIVFNQALVYAEEDKFEHIDVLSPLDQDPRDGDEMAGVIDNIQE